VLLAQGGVFALPQSWYNLAVGACGIAPSASSSIVQGIYLQLGIAATFFFALNVLFRLGTASYQISSNSARLAGAKPWVLVLFAGVPLTIIDPWNGAVFIESQFREKPNDPDVKNYRGIIVELTANWLLLFMEDIPQFIIQIIYAVIAAQDQNYGLSPAWFVAVFTTLMHMASQIHELVYLQYSLPGLKDLANQANQLVGSGGA
jgi:hypothetical protein